MIRFLPNFLTLVRLLLIIPIVYALLRYEYLLVLILFFIAAVTDLLDGLIARTFDFKTKFGSLLDPLADKCLILSISFTLWYLNLLPGLLIGVLMTRECLLVGTIFIYRLVYGPYHPEPLMLGKINTVLQLTLIILILINQLVMLSFVNTIINYFFVILIISSVLSVMQYIVLGLNRHWRATPRLT